MEAKHPQRLNLLAYVRSIGGLATNIPIGSMYGIFTYIHHEFMVNVGKYSIHGPYGIFCPPSKSLSEISSHKHQWQPLHSIHYFVWEHQSRACFYAKKTSIPRFA